MIENSENKVFNHAVFLLSRRDYTTHELKQKLVVKFVRSDKSKIENAHVFIEQAITKISEYGYLNDARYCESFIRMSAGKYRGKTRIKNELKFKGVNNQLIENAFNACEIDWFELATVCLERKLGNTSMHEVLSDHKLKSKYFRFLMSRGFNSEEIQNAMDELKHQHSE
ncbi:regulatory protein RecX [Sessilibacter corallicola]|uniref:Regulatory protein RecX n=1 Tax=Sessilibacter corallicola TaxID=2904075 RepID=A0ABQ0A3W2_9GAMM